MGTTVDKLNAVLASKNAIKEKFALPDDMPFSEYADNIIAGGSGDGDSYYGCTEVVKRGPLRLTATADNTEIIIQAGDYGWSESTYKAHWYYRTDENAEWTLCAKINDPLATLNTGDYIEFWCDSNTGTSAKFVTRKNGNYGNSSSGHTFALKASGDITSLVNYSGGVGTHIFRTLFTACSLATLPDLRYIKVINYAGCYEMFSGSQHVYTGEAVLDIDQLGEYGCTNMFQGNFVNATASSSDSFKLTIRVNNFNGNYALQNLMYNNKAIREVKAYFSSWTPSYGRLFYDWLSGTPDGGTFYKVSDLPAESGTNRIPSTWTTKVFDASVDLFPAAPTSDSWNGYKLNKVGDAYSWATDKTEGLTIAGATPIVEHIYNSNALFELIPTIEGIIPELPQPEQPEIVSIDIIPAINVEEGTAITEIDLNSYYIVRDSNTMNQIGTPTFKAISLPDGITLSGSTLSGTPTTAGEGNISILATYPKATDITITIAYAITAKPSGEDASYIEVAGAGTAKVNGKYYIVDDTATGYDREWKHETNDVWIFTHGMDYWYIVDDKQMMMGPIYMSNAGGVADPWDVVWQTSNGASPVPTVTLVSGGGDEPAQTITAPVLHMTTGGDSSAWGDYYLVDTNATGIDRVWKHTSADYSVKINEAGTGGPRGVEWHVVDSAGTVYSSAVNVFDNPYNDDGSSLSWMEGRWPIPCPTITMTMETYEVSGGGDTPEPPADPVYTITPYPASIALTGLKGSDVSARLIIELADEQGNVVNDTVTVTPNNMPNWLSINAQGMIFGNAAVEGVGEFTITLSHQYAQDVTVNVSYTISKPEIVSVDIIPAINVEEGTAITEINLNSYYIVRDSIATGTQIGTPIYSAISLPDGLTLSGSKLSGTPTTAGEGNISILATYPGAADFTITIAYAITAKPSGDGGTDLLVEGAGTSSFNGTYKLVNTSATGNDRVWKHTDNNSHVFYWSGTNKWLMQVGAEVAGPPAYASAAGVADPWEGTWGNEDGALPAPTVTSVGGNGGDSGETSITVTGFASVDFGDMDGTYADDGTGVRFVNDKDYSIRWVKSSEAIMFGPAQNQWCIVGPNDSCVYACIGGTEGDVSSIACTDKSIQLQVDAYAPPVTIVVSSGGSSGSSTITAPVLHFESQEHPALPGTDPASIDADGDYYLVDTTATGWYRVWKHKTKEYYIHAGNDGMDDKWFISSQPATYPDSTPGTCYAMLMAYNIPDPWTADGSSLNWMMVDWDDSLIVITMTEETYEVSGGGDSGVPTVTISGAYDYIGHFNDTYTYNADQQAWINSSGDSIYMGGISWVLMNGTHGTTTSLGGTPDDIASIAGTKSVMFDGEPANACQVTITVG